MSLIESLEIYIQAQRNVGKAALVFGTLFLIASFVLRMYGTSALSHGVKTGSLVIGIILYVLGVGLTLHQNNLLRKKKVQYIENKMEFRKSEIDRMSKVKKGYPKNQLVMTALACISLILFLTIKSDYWQGICLCIALYMVGNVIIEAFSHVAISRYYAQLLH